MKFQRKRGSTSNTIRVFIQDSSSTTGAGLTGLTNASTNLQISVIRELSASPTIYTGANIESIATIGTFAAPSVSTKCRFKEVDATNLPGVYELQFHDDAGHFGIADVSKNLQIYIFEITTTALNIAPCPIEIQLVAYDLEDAVRLGLTALPNAAAEAAGGLYTRGSGAGQINQPANGIIDSNIVRIGGAAQSATDLKDFADTGYDPAAHKVQGVVLVDTTTTNTDMVSEPPTAVAIRQEIDSNSTQLAAIVADTNELQTDWTNGGRLDLILDDALAHLKNKMTIDDTNSKLQLWNAAGDTVIYEWALTDKDGNAVVLTGTGPANRGVFSTP